MLPNGFEVVGLFVALGVWLAGLAAVALLAYWVVRMAVRHELRRAAAQPGASPAVPEPLDARRPPAAGPPGR